MGEWTLSRFADETCAGQLFVDSALIRRCVDAYIHGSGGRAGGARAAVAVSLFTETVL